MQSDPLITMAPLPADKRAVIHAIEDGKNVFITGGAGTGKTYLLNRIKEQFSDRKLHVTASTGIAAVHIGGVTLHSWAGLGVGNIPFEELLRRIFSRRGVKIRKKLRTAEILAIDEVSMLHAETFDLLNNLLQEVRGSSEPFGGLQLILFGDFLQLPPVVKRGEYQEEDGEDDQKPLYCFESVSWKMAQFEVHMLKQVFRQADDAFVGLLQRLRVGELTEADWQVLEEHKGRYCQGAIRPTILGTHNYQVDRINQQELARIPGDIKLYRMKEEGDKTKVEFLRRNCLAQGELRLKVGAQVMMLKNTYQEEGITNGSLGVIEGFSQKGFPRVRFANDMLITIEPEEWPVETFDEEKRKMQTLAKVRQIPLLLAWAITVHKSQGMTLDRIDCDLGKAFEAGQIYVAISRVKSLDGLYLRQLNRNQIGINEKVAEFYRQVEGG